MHMNELEIFLAALDIEDPQQRSSYLDEACGGDMVLRRQLDRLWDAHERSGQFLDVPALRQLAEKEGEPTDRFEVDADQAPQPSASAEQIDLSFLEPSADPNSLGRLTHYDIREVVGRGGCGIVLRAFDEKLERIVAVKVMAPELAATSPARKRFLREASATAAVRHPHVVTIYAVEEQPLPFLVMEFIDGQTLQQRSTEIGPFQVGDILRIGYQMADGLAAAHEQGLIHRDIKPANTLLERGVHSVKITDFGLARTADDASVTQSGCITGTPLYMSPEQALGGKLDQRSDLFSLGSVLYLMCTGRPPFRAPSSYAVLKRVVEEQPRPIREVIPEIPSWLVAIVDKLHAKKPQDRFESAAKVAELLKKCAVDIERRDGCELSPEVQALIPPLLSSLEAAIASPVAGSPQEPLRTRLQDALTNRRVVWLWGAAMLVTLGGVGFSVLPNRSPAGLQGVQSDKQQADPQNTQQDEPQTSRGEPRDTAGGESEFTRLFNDDNLAGWIPVRSPTIEWSNQDGTITARNRAGYLNSAGQLKSIKTYRDFHFRCEVLAGSGVMPMLLFRSNDSVQVGNRRGYALADPLPDSPLQQQGWGYGSLYADDFQVLPHDARLAASSVRDLNIKIGQWYQLEFIAEQQTVEVRINGISTVRYHSDNPQLNRAGSIGLRCGAGASLAIRNVELKEL